jgi:DNA (cytosine-5)-methyltransferase 1
MKTVGSDFSGVGAFNQALKRLGIEYNEIFACDMDKYARQTFIHNYGEPKYYPTNVYEREIPLESLDIYMTSPPCQAFSLAGKRLGKNDKRGILFFNSLEFIEKNKPRFFIFENVKGLLSDDNGKTFSEWVNFLGGKSVNGAPVLFPYADSVPYHLYWKVLNAKHHGVPQNRERVFLIGIRDDKDNNFSFPAEEHLTKRLKDVLEEEILEKFYLSNAAIEKCLKSQANKDLCIKEVSDISKCIVAGYYKIPFDGQYIKVQSNLEKYFLSEKMVNGFTKHNENHNEKGTGFIFEPKNENQIANCIRANAALCATDNTIQIKSATSNQGIMVAKICRSEEGKKLRKESMINGKDFTPFQAKQINFEVSNIMNCVTTATTKDNLLINNYQIRRLTPRECFRLMDFPDTFTWPVSDSQAYKQAGNSIVVNVLYKILKNLNI